MSSFDLFIDRKEENIAEEAERSNEADGGTATSMREYRRERREEEEVEEEVKGSRRILEFSWIKLQLRAMFSAVSILSPVNIQTLISKGISYFLF